jgi:hypothetical protein
MPHKKSEALMRAAIFMNLRLLNEGVGAARYQGLVMFDLAAVFNHPPRLVPAKCTSKEPLLGRIRNS